MLLPRNIGRMLKAKVKPVEFLRLLEMMNQFHPKHPNFSNTSTYDIDIDFRNDEAYDIDFSCTRVKNLLDNININKTPGPDGIRGSILKDCSNSLCRPLSISFKLIYNTGIIPVEWKSANIVPIQKRVIKLWLVTIDQSP